MLYLENNLVYVIDCNPKKSDKFKGTLYINSDDFAVLRLDYENIKPLSKFKLLGISVSSYLEKGRMRFSKFDGKKYNLSYFQSTRANLVSIKSSRPPGVVILSSSCLSSLTINRSNVLIN